MLVETDRALWQKARQRLFAPVNVVLAVLTVVCAAGLRIPEPVQYIPFAVSLVVLGLPHGALDHLVPSRLAGRAPNARAIRSVVVLYLAVGTAVILLWFVTPQLAFVGFILMTWFHWGQGDLFVEATRVGAAHPGRLTRIGVLLVRGALPMVVPLIAAPEVYLAVFRSTTGVIAAPVGDLVPVFESASVRLPLALALALLVIITFIGMARVRWHTPDGRRAWLGDLGEVALLAAFFAAVPPILAIGLYFCLWHSLRHIVRLSLLDPVSVASMRLERSFIMLRRFALQSAPVTLVALAILVALFFAVPRSGVSADALLGLYLVLISALTAPHVVIVSIMDRAQKAWSESPRRDLERY